VDFKATSGGGGSYEKPNPGTYLGVLIGVSDIGTQPTQFGNKRKIMLQWELHKKKGPVLDSKGNILTIRSMYNQSLHKESSLRPVVEAHIGVLSEDQSTNSRDWLGRAVRLVCKASDDGKYVNVDSVTALDPEDDTAPERVESTTHWEFSDGDSSAPKWCLDMIKKSTEYQAVHGVTPPKNGISSRPPNNDDDDDDIPF